MVVFGCTSNLAGIWLSSVLLCVTVQLCEATIGYQLSVVSSVLTVWCRPSQRGGCPVGGWVCALKVCVCVCVGGGAASDSSGLYFTEGTVKKCSVLTKCGVMMLQRHSVFVKPGCGLIQACCGVSTSGGM